jgi:cyclophilin family peptidyl-prolyl cis-trans isomerase
MTPIRSTHRLTWALAAAVTLSSCGGGGGDSGPSGPAVTSASIGAPTYGRSTLVTINGTGLDADLTVSSGGCKNMTRSTAAPNVSTATTAYYTCTVSAIGAQTVAFTRTSTAAALNTLSYTVPTPQVTMAVSNGGAIAGSMVFTLAPDRAPITVDNFLAYVNSGFFTDTIFHRVVKGFVIQGGGFLANGAQKTPSFAPIQLEVGKGLSNTQWTLAMARTNDLNSATSQFFINTVDNVALDTSGGGYAVFGSVTSNTALAAAIENAACSPAGSFCQPTTAIVITSATQTR